MSHPIRQFYVSEGQLALDGKSLDGKSGCAMARGAASAPQTAHTLIDSLFDVLRTTVIRHAVNKP
jgi:hypothetical protein